MNLLEIIKKEEIQQFYTLSDCIQAVESAFVYHYQNKVKVPLRTQITTDDNSGNFLCMPAYCADYDASCVKILNMFPNNINQGLPSINAQVMVIDPHTGLFDALLDGNYVTQLRTGAATGVAIKYLARKDAKIGALIGTGGQAITQLAAMVEVADLKEIRISDLNLERAEQCVTEMKKSLTKEVNLLAVDDANIAIQDADIIVTVTPSTKPVFDGAIVKKGALVSGVGAYQPHMQEVPSELITRADKIFFDSAEAVLAEAGDILIPLADGKITKSSFTGDIGQVILGELTGRSSEEEIIFFKTVGIAAQDLFTAKSIVDKKKNLS